MAKKWDRAGNKKIFSSALLRDDDGKRRARVNKYAYMQPKTKKPGIKKINKFIFVK